MKVFLDECVDWRLARDIVGHDVKTARQMGWTTIKNGTLLTLASEHFDVFVTVDRNLSFQQNLGYGVLSTPGRYVRNSALRKESLRLEASTRQYCLSAAQAKPCL